MGQKIYEKDISVNNLKMKVTYGQISPDNRPKEYALTTYVEDEKGGLRKVLERKPLCYLHLEEFLEFCRKIYRSIAAKFRALRRQ